MFFSHTLTLHGEISGSHSPIPLRSGLFKPFSFQLMTVTILDGPPVQRHGDVWLLLTARIIYRYVFIMYARTVVFAGRFCAYDNVHQVYTAMAKQPWRSAHDCSNENLLEEEDPCKCIHARSLNSVYQVASIAFSCCKRDSWLATPTRPSAQNGMYTHTHSQSRIKTGSNKGVWKATPCFRRCRRRERSAFIRDAGLDKGGVCAFCCNLSSHK